MNDGARVRWREKREWRNIGYNASTRATDIALSSENAFHVPMFIPLGARTPASAIGGSNYWCSSFVWRKRHLHLRTGASALPSPSPPPQPVLDHLGLGPARRGRRVGVFFPAFQLCLRVIEPALFVCARRGPGHGLRGGIHLVVVFAVRKARQLAEIIVEPGR